MKFNPLIISILFLLACGSNENPNQQNVKLAANNSVKASSTTQSTTLFDLGNCEKSPCNCVTENMLRSVIDYSGYIYSESKQPGECMYQWPGPFDPNVRTVGESSLCRISISEIDQMNPWNEYGEPTFDRSGFDEGIVVNSGIVLKQGDKMLRITFQGKDFKKLDENGLKHMEKVGILGKNLGKLMIGETTPEAFDIVYGRHKVVNKESEIQESELLPSEDKDLVKDGPFRYLNGTNYKLGTKNSSGLYSVWDVNQAYRFRSNDKKFKMKVLNHNAPEKLTKTSFAKSNIKAYEKDTEKYSSLPTNDKYIGVTRIINGGVSSVYIVTEEGYSVEIHMLSVDQSFSQEELNLLLGKFTIL